MPIRVSSPQVASASKIGNKNKNKNKKQNGQTGNTNRSIGVISGVSNSDINNEKNNDIRWYIALAVFTIAFAFLIYFLTNKNTTEENTPPPTEQNSTMSAALDPKPNAILSDKDREETIRKQLKKGIILNEVVNGIFNGNPNDIGTYYKWQEESYGNLLVEKNKECFEKKEGTIRLKDINLKEIPCYKK